jgi:hypothetical protein
MLTGCYEHGVKSSVRVGYGTVDKTWDVVQMGEGRHVHVVKEHVGLRMVACTAEEVLKLTIAC